MTRPRLLLLSLLILALAAFFVFDLERFLSLEFFKSQQAAVEAYRDAHPLVAAVVFFTLYVLVTGLSLPGAAVMTLIAGALFGLLWGTLIVSFASSIGATLAFLAARFLARDWVQKRAGTRLKAMDEGIAKDGAFYLFTLRLVPVFPLLPDQPGNGPDPVAGSDFLLG